MDLFFASENRHKAIEVSELLDGLPLTLLSYADFPQHNGANETGNTLAENALLKARLGFQQTGLPTFADDTGLFVNALGGAPGVFAARYSGPDATYASNCEKLLRELAHVPDGQRQAEFRCVIALVLTESLANRLAEGVSIDRTGGQPVVFVTGVVAGTIARQAGGGAGFGYDPLFYIPDQGQTFAELDLQTKNIISHRGQAVAQLRRLLAGLLK